MSCFYPLWGKPPTTEGGKTTFSALAPTTATGVKANQNYGLMPIPCGHCYGCRSDQRLQWTIRNTHEASLHQDTTFLTLTIDDEHLPWHGSLDRALLQNFLKRLRHECNRVHNPTYRNSRPNTISNAETRIRFFACGEYGTTTKRAHYHALLYNMWPRDAQVYGADTYTSSTMSELWKEGSHQFSRVNPDRIAYVCGYTVKKMGTIRDRTAYGVVDPETGEYFERQPEFAVMSRRPGIGAGWFEKFNKDLRRGYLHHEGSKVTVPRFYERKYQETYPEEVEERKLLRAKLRDQHDPKEQTLRRLADKEAVKRSKDKTYAPTRYKEL